MQIRPTKLTDKKQGPKLNKGFFSESLSKKIYASEVPLDLRGMMIFTRQFSSLVDSGCKNPIVQCLDILWQQERRPGFKRILEAIKSDIEGGSGLAEALGRHPSAFSEFFVRIVEAGEVSGTLDSALRRVGVQLEKLGRLKAKVINALMYPCITIIVAIVVLGFLLVKVMHPEVAKLYSESHAQLPDITLFVLGLSKWFQDYWLYLVGGMISIVFGGIFLYRLPETRRILDPLVLKIPIIGTLLKKSMIARFTRTLSTLMSSGVPLLQSFEICVNLVTNTALRAIIRNTADFVQEGKTIAQGLAEGGNVFPPMVVHMVGIGEMTGKLDELLGKVADIFDDEVDDAVANLTGVLQPALIVVVGLLVAFLLVSMYMPIFQLAEKVTGG